ncbi:MAG: enoyl-CoA hydratase/isomerase family protein [Syntrophorhabdaceae bacterium]|nr:enoyl-CoA hydratase/isomerase family protein [Syntrophorhabdaceae bacterium]
MEVVLYSHDGGVSTITLNRPEKKNAMDYELLKGLNEALKKAEEDNPQVIVIRGAGGAFCSGGDIIAFRDADDAESLIDKEAAVLNDSIKIIRKSPSIVIAVVEGVAVGAGMGLALACDISIATKNTIMNMGYRRIGLTPDGGGSIFLPRIIGLKRYNELYLFSKNIDMAKALEMGLVNIVCEAEEIDKTLEGTIKELLSLPLETIKYFKDLVNASLFPDLDIMLDKERFYVAQMASKPLFKERIVQFLKKK